MRLKTAKQRSASSQRWLERQLNDPYVAAAKREGYRSRAAFKLDRDRRQASPPQARQRVSWTSAPRPAAGPRWPPSACARWQGKGQVVAIDLLDVEPIAGVEHPAASISWTRAAPGRLTAMLREGKADVVLSDMAAQGTGHTRTDHLRIMGLAEAAAEFACEVLVPAGHFCARCSRAAPSASCWIGSSGLSPPSGTSSRRRAAPNRPSST